jgi:hypothetical protein
MSSNQQLESNRGLGRWAALAAIAAGFFLTALFAARAIAQDESDYLATPTPAPWTSPTAQQLAQGKADFMHYCAPCHSESGKGNGPEVKVIPGIKPKDLTKIALHNGGVFPYQNVEDIVDGRKSIPSHTRYDMPFWGVNFQQAGQEFTTPSERKAKARIDAIVDYIATIQAD